jgi:RimJ/RimL family protein N-acetyltransferase
MGEDEDGVRRLGSLTLPLTETVARQWIHGKMGPGRLWFAIVTRNKERKLLGMVGLDIVSDGEVTLAYWIGPPYRGHGYATEAVDQLLGLAALFGIRTIRAYVRADNLASGRVLLRNGFTYLGPSESTLVEKDTGETVTLEAFQHQISASASLSVA